MRMKLTVVATGKTTATVILTQDQVDAIRGSEGRARVPLQITAGKQQFRTSVSVYRGEWMLQVTREMQDGGLAPGATYDVDVAVDTAERTVEVPADLAAALKKAKLTAAWDALSYTKRKEYARQVEDAKKPETRTKRIESTVSALGG